MSLYKDWGYTSNPFRPTPIEPTIRGIELLVGREKEKKKLKNRLKNDSGIITIEGENGIGKTSVINGSIFELYEESLLSKDDQALYLPCNQIFQISPTKNLGDFIDEFYFTIAQTIIDKKKEIKENGYKNLKTDNLNKWLNSTIVTNIEAQIAGFGGTYNQTPNESNGFMKSGFKKQIKSLLSNIFPNSESGGIICVIDNLELLETSDDAKRILEYLRDELLNMPEIKWFFSGSHNIFRTFISTPRLSGFINNPIKISHIHSINVPSILNSRINSYQNHVDNKPYCPILDTDFIKLFESLNGNLREVFKRLSAFYLHIYELDKEEPYSQENKNIAFEEWFEEDKNLEFDAIKNVLKDSEIKLLKILSLRETELITNTDYKNINLESISALRTAISNLEKYGLIFIPILENEFIEQNKYTEMNDLLKNVFLSPKSHYIKHLICE
ncbi:hypothetical protein [Flavobacterium sp. SM2513]|uniref:hypothetical protein n=1 Tax=Flavobacterium sp. SM2513 TaxID=3424766 RepID=UPI003D7F8B97